MLRLLETLTLAGIAAAIVACSDSMTTAPATAPNAGATRDLVGLSAPGPTASCTVTADGSSYSVTVTWSDLMVTSIDFLQGSTLLARSEFSHPLRNGSLTVSLLSAPTVAQLIGTRLGVRTVCS
jgi:hypothetical protein